MSVLAITLFYLVVPAGTFSVSKVFFRLTTVSLTQMFGEQVVVSNCIQALEILVRETIQLHTVNVQTSSLF